MAQRYMLNTKTEKVYVFHPETIKRADMVEITEAQAKNMMAGKPLMAGVDAKDVLTTVPGSAPEAKPAPPDELAYYKKKLAMALELLGMSSPEQLPDDLTEGKVIMDDVVPASGEEATDEQAAASGQPDDPDIAMLEQIRAEGKGKANVEAYCLEKFGLEMDHRMRLNDLVDKAVELRKAEIENASQEVPEQAAPEQPDF